MPTVEPGPLVRLPFTSVAIHSDRGQYFSTTNVAARHLKLRMNSIPRDLTGPVGMCLRLLHKPKKSNNESEYKVCNLAFSRQI